MYTLSQDDRGQVFRLDRLSQREFREQQCAPLAVSARFEG
jgi:hypothetical protein